MAADLMEGIESNGLGEDEKNYRREQTIFWLIRAAERGSKVRIEITLRPLSNTTFSRI
jgi:hypothetical protein